MSLDPVYSARSVIFRLEIQKSVMHAMQCSIFSAAAAQSHYQIILLGDKDINVLKTATQLHPDWESNP